MAATVTKTPLFTSGEIRWSDLRNSFKGGPTTEIRTGELLRNTSGSVTDPIVPDATENSAVASSTNWSASQMRNTIKTYDITQTGTNNNNSSLSAVGFNIGTQDWNANLGKNIKKRMIIDGAIGSSNISQYACYLNELAYNLRIEVNGIIQGMGGTGSTSGTGQNGGPAMYVRSTGGSVNVVVGGAAQIYGGGAGGSKGRTGSNGNDSTCRSSYDYDTGRGCQYCPGCASGETDIGCRGAGVCRSGKGWAHYWYIRKCRHYFDYSVPGALGGVGGNGGNGTGYTRTRSDAPDFGSSGGPARGATGGCPNYGGNGYDGERGSHGADWGGGASSTNLAGGASGGRAISGSNYIVNGSVSATTIKGAYAANE